MEPLGFELGQAPCFVQELAACEGREEGVQRQAGLGHSAGDATAAGANGVPGSRSQLLRATEQVHSRALVAVG